MPVQRTIIVNDVEPSPLSMRQPTGVDLDLRFLFRNSVGAIIDPTPLVPQLTFTARSSGRVNGYDVNVIDVPNGVGVISIPGTAIVDVNGYRLEMYQRSYRNGTNNPPVPIGLIGLGDLVVRKGAYAGTSPLSPISVPVVVGPPGPPGPVGPASTVPGPAGTRGSVWTSGAGAPIATGSELVGDMYLDEATGNVWRFEPGGTWMMSVP